MYFPDCYHSCLLAGRLVGILLNNPERFRTSLQDRQASRNDIHNNENEDESSTAASFEEKVYAA